MFTCEIQSLAMNLVSKIVQKNNNISYFLHLKLLKMNISYR